MFASIIPLLVPLYVQEKHLSLFQIDARQGEQNANQTEAITVYTEASEPFKKCFGKTGLSASSSVERSMCYSADT